MPYVIPTPDQFYTRFPEFLGESPERVEMLLQDAARSVDTTWFEGDYQRAIMYLAAHYLVRGDAASAGGGGGDISSENFGGISVSYSRGGSGAGADELLSTTYGSMFYDVLRANRTSILVV